ncbi:hypothetical protein AQUCO_00200235v1 [Aquilegia coerulea]|uniref:Uncharacterized protein n=1 Tax=Aquilegia coerulea TaxID=218851 RepID=A0A2G5F245_AQUCA|nr:hypothetical protein AQUCO_00200235v1 [Aquilegia coerulea]PIA62094.1 hypothetical protein AQUCO_00200235v1 [Aquilegia coerulea]PIA62095.1 hypothetical protein AQUCO_00200235v1 [Aquilegia coerulea]
MTALLNDTICLLGVFGMAGIGKTKLMEALSKRVKQEKLFDEVVMVTISENPDVKAIQNNVAKELGMRLDDSESISCRARRLHDRLNQTEDKRILIVLDDLWNELNLEVVGIPKKSRCKSYKIVITTRFQQVCARMGTDLEWAVPILSKQDSWILFRKNVGDVVDSCQLETIAREVVDECAGLPLAIVALGRALRKKTVPSVWADALRRLKMSINGDLMRVVGCSIKLSYDFLPNEVEKRCFLFCSLFPEDYIINVKEELLVYVVGEKLLEDGEDYFNSLEETKGRLDSIVEDLISSSLLLGGYDIEYIKMHDVVRDVAKMIAFKDEELKQRVEAGMDLKRWPEQLESCKRLSLMGTNIMCNLPRQVEAPQLLTLILNDCNGFSELPFDFFKKMKKLKNLDLSFTDIASLPSSILCLVELRTLRLVCCRWLKNISPVEKLEKLEILDLSHSGIETLPEAMVMLTKLKRLNMYNMSNLTCISPKVISSMCQLEELCVVGVDINTNLSEVALLANLTYLEIGILNLECFSSNTIHWLKLKQYVIMVGCLEDFLLTSSEDFEFDRRLYLSIPPSITVSNAIIWLLRRADFLFLSKCNDLESVVQLDPTEVFKYDKLKFLMVFDCSEIKYLINSIEVEKAPEISFSNLEVLQLGYLDNFRYVLPMSVARHLNQLVKISVWNCPRIKMIIASDNVEDDRDKYVLPRLKILMLRNLPALVSFGRSGLVFYLDSLEGLSLRNCGNLKSLPCRVTQQRLSKFKGFELDVTLINLLEDPAIKHNLEHVVEDDGSSYYQK